MGAREHELEEAREAIEAMTEARETAVALQVRSSFTRTKCSRVNCVPNRFQPSRDHRTGWHHWNSTSNRY